MNYDWIGKTIYKKSNPGNFKKSKNQSEIAASEYETTSKEAKFCSNTNFSLCLKIWVNKFNAA